MKAETFADLIARQTKKRPTSPGIPLPPPWNRRDPTQKEAPILRAVIGLLRFRGCWVQRVEGSGKLQHRRGGDAFLARSEMTGLPDVLALHGGVLFALEVKAPGGHLSEAQREKLQAMAAAGARVAVVVGTDSLWDWMCGRCREAGAVGGIPVVG